MAIAVKLINVGQCERFRDHITYITLAIISLCHLILSYYNTTVPQESLNPLVLQYNRSTRMQFVFISISENRLALYKFSILCDHYL